MTFSVLVTKENQRRVEGTVWAENEAKARDLAPVLLGCGPGEELKLLATESREIPLRLTMPAPMHFC